MENQEKIGKFDFIFKKSGKNWDFQVEDSEFRKLFSSWKFQNLGFSDLEVTVDFFLKIQDWKIQILMAWHLEKVSSNFFSLGIFWKSYNHTEPFTHDFTWKTNIVIYIHFQMTWESEVILKIRIMTEKFIWFWIKSQNWERI